MNHFVFFLISYLCVFLYLVTRPFKESPKNIFAFCISRKPGSTFMHCRFSLIRIISCFVLLFFNQMFSFLPTGICSVLFEARMGCMNEVVPEETQKFIFSVGEMFRLSPIVVLFPKVLWPYLPAWKQFVATWDHLFSVGTQNNMKM